eukprot:8002799-Pyramimonas_sp.AAC.1
MSWKPLSLSDKPSLPARATVMSVFSEERLNTEMEKPFSATFSARFCENGERLVKPSVMAQNLVCRTELCKFVPLTSIICTVLLCQNANSKKRTDKYCTGTKTEDTCDSEVRSKSDLRKSKPDHRAHTYLTHNRKPNQSDLRDSDSLPAPTSP